MGIFDKLFGMKKAKENKEIEKLVKDRQKRTQALLEYLDSAKGTEELYEMLCTRSADEIEELIRTFPIETLRLDWDSVAQDFRNHKRFEIITFLAQILVQYDLIRRHWSHLNLPESLPAEELAEILMSRLMPFIRSQQGIEIAASLKTRLLDFAIGLMQAGRDHDALTCLLVSRGSIREDHEFWICACRYNIAQTTKNDDDIIAAIESAEQIVSGEIRVPEKYVQGVKQMLNHLKRQLEKPKEDREEFPRIIYQPRQ